MNSLWTTLIEINLILSIIYLGYRVLLKNLTFFRWARFYLLGGMLIGLIYPFLKARKVIQTPTESVTIALPDFAPMSTSSPVSWENWAVYLFSATLVFLFFRFAFRFFSLGKIHADSSEAEFNGHIFQDTRRQVPPFSFWKWIYIHRKAHSDTEMKQIITHEHIHTRERHTIDVIIAEICNLICWYNPLVKLLNRSVKDNLEFLVDHEVLNSGIDRISYQHSLVGISLNSFPGNYPGNQFAFKTLKRRIQMMNKTQSSKLRLVSYLVLTPLVLGLAGLLTFSCQKETPYIPAETQKSDAMSAVIAPADTATQEALVVTGRKLRVKLSHEKPATTQAFSQTEKDKNTETALQEALVVTGRRTPPRPSLENSDTPQASFKTSTQWETATHNPSSKSSTIEGVELKAVGTHNAIAFEAKGFETDHKNNFVLHETVKIRGTYLNPSVTPLFMLDGNEIPNLQGIAVENIQSIAVLKDKSAVGKYGEKGKNGVVEIYSKKSPR